MEKEGIKFFDANITRRGEITDKSINFFKDTNIAMPSIFEISNSGMCNRKCSFCPRSDPNYNHVNEFISEKLHDKIYNELSINKFSGSIIFSGFVEPLLDKRIYKQIKDIRNKLPQANIELITNGDPLNLKRLEKLFQSGLNRILISAYDGKEDADKLENLCKSANLSSEQYIVRHRYYSEEKDFGITLSNRSGLMENAEFKIKSLTEPLKNPCYIPSYTFFLDYQGDVLMCPHDWGKKVILGNLNNENLIDIWFSKKSMQIRKMLNKANRNFTPCNVCDVEGTFMGEKNSFYFN